MRQCHQWALSVCCASTSHRCCPQGGGIRGKGRPRAMGCCASTVSSPHVPGGAAATPVCPLTKSQLAKAPQQPGPPSPITQPGMSPPQASALWGPLGRGWWPLSVPLCRRVTSQGTPEPTRPVATVFPHHTAGVKPQKWKHSSSGNVRDDREAQGTAQSFLQGWGGAQDGTNSKEKRQKNPSGVIYLHQGSPRAGAVGAGGVLRGCRGVWGYSQGAPGS